MFTVWVEKKKSVNTIFLLFLVVCFQLPTTRTPDYLKMFSIYLKGLSYQEATVLVLPGNSIFFN